VEEGKRRTEKEMKEIKKRSREEMKWRQKQKPSSPRSWVILNRQWNKIRNSIAQSMWWLHYRLDDQKSGVRISGRGKWFSLLHNVQTGSGAHPATYTMVTGDTCKQQGREADHSPPSSTEVKNAWSFTSTLSCALSWCAGTSPNFTCK
jgi:hypothetical protein